MGAALFFPLLLLALSPGPAPASPPDLAALLARAQEVQVTDTAAWRTFRFRREWLREDLDESGAVAFSGSRISRVTPVPGGFDEELLRIDGRSPTPREAESHRREGPFQKHFRTMLDGEDGAERDGTGYSLGDLLRMSSYRYAGEESVEGIRCHRLEFAPDPGKKTPGMAGKFADAMAGTLWITTDGLHLFRARAATVKPVSFLLALAKVHGLRLEMESGEAGSGVWLPRRIVMEINSRVFMSASRRRSTYLYSDFLPAGGKAGP